MDIIVEATKETLEILEKGYYEINGKRVVVADPPEKAKSVFVVTPEYVAECVKRAEEKNVGTLCPVTVDDLDTFGSAEKNGEGKTVVLNFANAFYPGGGFLRCSRAQEENLCRCSTLYASLSSEEAAVMYQYNKANRRPQGSDYMLISEDVAVFRNVSDLSLRAEPYRVDVVTAAAPNRYGEAMHASDEEVEAIFRLKIEKLLAVLADRGYDTLILGAWGCGAFGNDSKTVAAYFREALYDKKYATRFKKVVFSVYVNPRVREMYNYTMFKRCFEA